MSQIGRRVEALEKKTGPVRIWSLTQPPGLTEEERIAWEAEATSPEAQAAAGMSGNFIICIRRMFGPRRQHDAA